MNTGVSVIIPTFKGASRINECLKSLAQQTLNPEMFEVIVVVNGTDFAEYNLFPEDFVFSLVILHSITRGVSLARNIGITNAKFDYVVFIDDDDYVSKRYLENLLNNITPNSIVLSDVKKVNKNGLCRSKYKKLIEYNDYIYRISILLRFVTINAGKIIPTWLLRKYTFPIHLKSSEDMVVMSTIIFSEDLSIKIVDELDETIYFRTIRNSSLSRQSISFDFMIVQRYQVISAILKSSSGVINFINPVKLLFLLSRVLGEIIYGIRIFLRAII